MTGFRRCSVCSSIASAVCKKCGVSLCDTTCLDAHRMDEKGKNMPPPTSKSGMAFVNYKYRGGYRNPWDDAA
jgi:hypothetical protein